MYDWYPMNAGPTTMTGDTFPLGNQTIVGTCSCCGGPVCVPTAYHSVIPPVPTCQRCGATKRQSYGPVIDMVPAGPITRWYMKYDSTVSTDVKSLLTGKSIDQFGNEWSTDGMATNKPLATHSAMELVTEITKPRLEALQKELDSVREQQSAATR